ncbi:hypothetical protein D3H64_06285 [Atopobacter sp. AH10]|uniref:hypothetical protein n=1 Tax=Atopobacter sp. AH10 TaxID=2315861 RepID=UPI000EF26BCE|nr:hypothetical protein [Atopobacter sp. AH10]RLK63096.1 hypothetical protein D3H64_06285 [Atopobacter sp. AH10]
MGKELQTILEGIGLKLKEPIIWQESLRVITTEVVAAVQVEQGAVLVEKDGVVRLTNLSLSRLMQRIFYRVERAYRCYRQRSGHYHYQPVYSLESYFFPAIYMGHSVRAWINLGAIDYVQIRQRTAYFLVNGKMIWQLPKSLLSHLIQAPGIQLFLREEDMERLDKEEACCYRIESLAAVLTLERE